MRRNKRRSNHENVQDKEQVVIVALSEIYVSEKNVQRVLRDQTQIEKMRRDFEYGRNMVRVVLHPRLSGGYDVSDGRHRVIAARLAGDAYIDAIIVGE
jgi:hypothetical protein